MLGVIIAWVLQRHGQTEDEEKEDFKTWQTSVERQLVRLGEKLDGQREQLAIYTAIFRYLHPELKEFLEGTRNTFRSESRD